MKRLFIFFLLLFSGTLSAQTGILTGNVTDSRSRTPIPGVTVVVNDSAGVSTDEKGNYSFSLWPGTYRVEFRMIGYLIARQTVLIAANTRTPLNVALEENTMQLNTVVVSAGRYEQKLSEVTVSMEVLKPSLINNTNTTNMETVIDQVPGVTVVDGQANIRGGSGFSYGAGSRVLVLVDDLPMLSADAGDVKWNFLPVENTEQVEIIKGASSVLFGSSAMNGVINLRTSYPRDTPLTRLSIYSGMYDSPRDKSMIWWGKTNPFFSGANFLHSRKAGPFDLVTGGHVFSDEGYREGEKEQRMRMNINTRYRFKNIEGLSAGINANAMHTRGGLYLMWANDTSGALRPLGGLDSATTTISNFENRRVHVDPFVSYYGKKGAIHKLRTRYYHTANNNDSQQESFSDFYYGEYQFHSPVAKTGIKLTSGITFTSSQVEGDLYGIHKGHTSAVYAQADKKWRRFNFSLGARMESLRLDTVKTSSDPVLRAGINFQAAKVTFLRASFGQGYRYPSVAEKFIKTGVGSIYLYPNDTLTAETGWTLEAGFKQGLKLGNWMGYVDVAGFRSRYKNMLEFTFGQWGDIFKDPFYGFGFKTVNVGDILITGGEISLAGEGSIGEVHLAVLGGYTYIDPLQDRYDSLYVKMVGTENYMGTDSSNFLKYRSSHLARADVEMSLKKLSAAITMRYNSFMKNIDRIFENPAVVPGVENYREDHPTGDIVFDVRTAIQLTSHIRLSFLCKNIFNRIYMGRPADMQPPRNFAIQAGAVF